MACSEWYSDRASTIWFFQRGIVLTHRGADLLGHQAVDPFCTMRICGAICTEIVRVSSAVVYLLLEASYEVCEIIRGLRTREARSPLASRDVLWQLNIAQVLYLELTGEDYMVSSFMYSVLFVLSYPSCRCPLHQRDLVLSSSSTILSTLTSALSNCAPSSRQWSGKPS